MVKARSVMDKLIYKSNYETLEENMSPSNIGARKGRNIRDHLFVINAILEEVSEKKTNAELQIYDVKACFDKLWSNEASNDVFENGLSGDHFIFAAKANESCNVSIKMPWGKRTENINFKRIELQGSVSSPMRCSITTDSLGKEILSNYGLSQILYKYRGCVMIPPLMMIDDVLSVTECGVNSLKMNALVLSKMATKRLELGASKCYQLHVGKTVSTSPSLQVDTGLSMEKATKQRYLGDIISSDSKIDANIKMRYDKGILINNEILSILREVNLGSHFFEIAFMLHSSLLINGILYSTEALFRINNQHIEKLMSIERDLL